MLAGAAPNHLVFLVDVSSSMNKPEKLPLLRESLLYLIEIMRPEDRLTLIAYAGKTTVHLEASSSADKARLINQLNHLHTGGETKIRRGLKAAYKLARKHFIPNGNNRIILASDGMVPMNRSTQNIVKKMAWEEIAFSTFHLTKGSSALVQSNLVELAKLGTGHYHHVEARQCPGSHRGGSQGRDPSLVILIPHKYQEKNLVPHHHLSTSRSPGGTAANQQVNTR